MITAYIFPTYNESRTLPRILEEIMPFLGERDVVVVADDSNFTEKRIITEIIRKYRNVVLLSGEEKGGRGAAVRRAIEWILDNRPDVTHFIEADCDGSHRVADIMTLSKFDPTEHFVIGSRYLPSSDILGWTIHRRLMSKFLNYVIPRVLKIEVTDITNGLRRYSESSARLIVRAKSVNKGFIYLSEQALTLNQYGISPKEVPIVFESRIAGESSVTFRDLLFSLTGLFAIIKIRFVKVKVQE